MAGQSVEIEARGYGPDSTPEEVEALLARISLHGPDTLLWRELPVMTCYSVDLHAGRVEELCAAHGCRLLIVDSSAGARPDAAVRKRLRERSQRLAKQIDHVAVVIKASPLVKVAARFIQAASPMPMTIHDSMAEAEEELRRVRQR